MTRRILGALVTALMATLGVAAWANPAQATGNHTPAVTITDTCTTTTLTATWAIDDSQVDNTTLVVQAGGEQFTAAVGDEITVAASMDEPIKWRVAGGAERDYDQPKWSVTLDKLKWYIGKYGAEFNDVTNLPMDQPWFVGWYEHIWEAPKGGCPKPGVEFVDNCFGVLIYLSNSEQDEEGNELATAPARFIVNKVHINPLEPGFAPGDAALILAADQSPIMVRERTTGLKWEHGWTQPEGCEGTPTPAPSESPSAPPESPAPGVGGGLPLTGAPVGVLAAGGGLLLAAGTAGVVLGLRRRVTFIA